MANNKAFGQEKTGIYDPIAYEQLGRVGNSEDGEAYQKTQEVLQAYRMDDTTTANVIYEGWAIPGSLTGDSVWRICNTDVSSGVIVTWADGNLFYDNEWDNRATTVVYS